MTQSTTRKARVSLLLAGSLAACIGMADEPQPTFAPWSDSPYAASYQPEDIALGDFNGDGHLDIATSSTQGFVGILLSQGNHSIVAAQGSPFYTSFGFIRSAHIADFNEDGHLDVAGVDTFTSSILIMNGDGSGALIPAVGSPFPAGLWAWHMALGDFNGDGTSILRSPIRVRMRHSSHSTMAPATFLFHSSSLTRTERIPPTSLPWT